MTSKQIAALSAVIAGLAGGAGGGVLGTGVARAEMETVKGQVNGLVTDVEVLKTEMGHIRNGQERIVKAQEKRDEDLDADRRGTNQALRQILDRLE